MDIVIPIVFPDYLIGAGKTPKIEVDVPDLLPLFDIFPDQIRIPSKNLKLPELGHAGVLFINGRSGATRYFEYGRYDRAKLGLAHRKDTPPVKIGKDNKPTHDSFKRVLARISKLAGNGGRIEGAYIEVADGKFISMLQYANKRVMQNRMKNRKPYDIATNSCMHFSKEVVESAGVQMPWILDPRPNSFIAEVQSNYPKIKFVPQGVFTISN